MNSLLFLLTAIPATLAAAVDAPATTINFAGNWETKVSGPIRAGSDVDIVYDMARAQCPSAVYMGFETRNVLLTYTTNGSDQKRIGLGNGVGNNSQQLKATIKNVPAGDLEMWVVCSSYTKTTYDSDFGKNFHFKIE